MIPANLNIEIDEKAIKQHIEKRLDEVINETLVLVDVKGLAKRLSMSERFIEEEFLHDPRVRQFEVRKSKKRWFWYQQSIEAITEIINEW
ncbi:hypothetical protein H9636_02710 [Ureibacillus sp. Re31]|uniref:Uncharacterized protein n=1 Tax=Ureibacillus galli TaxID=2762222 RepID=A0ABR8X8B5_9BACL|nr:hypothetical protein [Ureibacillus galli]MBD8025562.1 hypothetical protein [Ureibacillus galli]